MNQTRLTACIVEIGVLRLTPAGVPALDARLEHESQQEEGGSPRQVKAALKAVAFMAALTSRGWPASVCWDSCSSRRLMAGSPAGV